MVFYSLRRGKKTQTKPRLFRVAVHSTGICASGTKDHQGLNCDLCSVRNKKQQTIFLSILGDYIGSSEEFCNKALSQKYHRATNSLQLNRRISAKLKTTGRGVVPYASFAVFYCLWAKRSRRPLKSLEIRRAQRTTELAGFLMLVLVVCVFLLLVVVGVFFYIKYFL